MERIKEAKLDVEEENLDKTIDKMMEALSEEDVPKKYLPALIDGNIKERANSISGIDTEITNTTKAMDSIKITTLAKDRLSFLRKIHCEPSIDDTNILLQEAMNRRRKEIEGEEKE